MARLRRLDDLIAALAKQGVSPDEALIDEDSLIIHGEEEANETDGED